MTPALCSIGLDNIDRRISLAWNRIISETNGEMMDTDERLHLLEEYIRQDAERWQEIHARMDAYRVAFGAALEAVEASPAEVRNRFSTVLTRLVTISKQHNARSALIAELVAIKESIAITFSAD